MQSHMQAEHRQCHVESEESTKDFTDAQKKRTLIRNVSRETGRMSSQVFSFPSLGWWTCVSPLAVTL